MRSSFSLALVAALVVSFAGASCVRRYDREPALEFQDLAYQSTNGTPWPTTRIELPRAQAKFKLGNHHHVSVVEMNPTGERTIVFLHGLGSYVSFWRYQLDVFAAQGYRVIAFDQLGYGKSDKPAMFPYTMDAMAEVVDEVMDVMHVEKATIIGHSMGGEEAMALAVRFPARVERLVLTSPAGFEPFTPREKQWFHTAVTKVFVKATTEYGIWGSVRAANFVNWRPELEFLIEERVRLIKAKQFDSYAYAQVRSISGLANNDFVRDSLGLIDAPTLIVYGELDRLIPNAFLHGGKASEWMTYGAEHIRGAKLEAIAGCGHTVQMDCPDKYNTIVTAFLDDAAPVKVETTAGR